MLCGERLVGIDFRESHQVFDDQAVLQLFGRLSRTVPRVRHALNTFDY